MNRRDARRAAAERLRAAGVDDPDLESEVLLRHALGIDRAALFAHFDTPLTDSEQSRYEALLTRRLRREPTAYITSHREFYGLDFAVTPAVLIPRPETEVLVEAARAWLRTSPLPAGIPSPYTERGPRGEVIVDVGTGSGAIAIAIAANHLTARIVATDVSRNALAVVRENARRHGVGGRVWPVATDLLAGVTGPVDVIVANPPYVRSGDIAALQPEVRDHEPRLALDGGSDGLDVVRRLLAQAASFVAEGTALYIEIGDDEGTAALAAARAVMLPKSRIEVRPDLAGRDRMLAVEPG